jgi:hypothetical protein
MSALIRTIKYQWRNGPRCLLHSALAAISWLFSARAEVNSESVMLGFPIEAAEVWSNYPLGVGLATKKMWFNE